MRGHQDGQITFSFITPGDFVPLDHPIRAIKRLADECLARLSPLFDSLYSARGRPSIPPERLLKSTLLMALFTVRSERAFAEHLGYNLLFKWFLDMNVDDMPFDASSFAKNKERLLKADVAGRFFEEVLGVAREAELLSDEHFTVDGTLIEAWASMKSFRPKDEPTDGPLDPGNDGVSFRGEKRLNDTHESTTDPEARLMRKGPGKEAKLCFGLHAMMENRNGMCVGVAVTHATGTSEREAGLEMLGDLKRRGGRPKSLGADKGYDVASFVEGVRTAGVTPHVAAKRSRGAIDRRTTRHATYALSQRLRKRVEEIFGWTKTIAGFRKTRYKGVERTGLCAQLVATAYNLVRMAKLMTATATT